MFNQAKIGSGCKLLTGPAYAHFITLFFSITIRRSKSLFTLVNCSWRSGEGTIFTGVCHSVHRRGGWVGLCLFPACITGHMTS